MILLWFELTMCSRGLQRTGLEQREDRVCDFYCTGFWTRLTRWGGISQGSLGQIAVLSKQAVVKDRLVQWLYTHVCLPETTGKFQKEMEKGSDRIIWYYKYIRKERQHTWQGIELDDVVDHSIAGAGCWGRMDGF